MSFFKEGEKLQKIGITEQDKYHRNKHWLADSEIFKNQYFDD